ncbi:MAG: S26 family signal peptidase [Pirellulales bacterium]
MPPNATHSSPSQASAKRAARSLVGALVGLALAATLVNTWVVEGLFVPLVVSGGSMAPALLGAHRRWRCDECGRTFACNLESLPADGAAATCPHCGAPNDQNRGVDAPGDRVLVDRSAFCWRPPRRWETVVVRSPENPDVLCVKRVVGLPGELIDVDEGDVLVDGAVARKDLAALRAMAVSVSGPNATERWRGDAQTWRLEDGWFVHDGRGGESIDWLSYRHAEHSVRRARGAGQSILDASAYDQNESRLLNEVDDVMLRCDIQAAGAGFVHVRARCRGDDFQFKLDTASGELELAHNGRMARRFAADDLLNPERRPSRLEFVVADRRVQFALAGRVVAQYDYEPANVSPCVGKRVLAVGARGARVRVRKLEVSRDVYYTADPAGHAAQYRLGEREYFLLGDNSPHSLDSRVWLPRGRVSASLLLGPALAW